MCSQDKCTAIADSLKATGRLYSETIVASLPKSEIVSMGAADDNVARRGAAVSRLICFRQFPALKVGDTQLPYKAAGLVRP